VTVEEEEEEEEGEGEEAVGSRILETS